MPLSSTGGDVQRKILIALEHILGQDVDESDRVEDSVDDE